MARTHHFSSNQVELLPSISYVLLIIIIIIYLSAKTDFIYCERAHFVTIIKPSGCGSSVSSTVGGEWEAVNGVWVSQPD